MHLVKDYQFDTHISIKMYQEMRTNVGTYGCLCTHLGSSKTSRMTHYVIMKCIGEMQGTFDLETLFDLVIHAICWGTVMVHVLGMGCP
jgi:hypothetical protein